MVGGGIVGLATTRALLLTRPGLQVTVLERAAAVGAHQSSHNSGVLHAGVYYPPGSRKAEFCTVGRTALERYATENGIRWERCGKLIVAVRRDELGRLAGLERRAAANGLTGVRRLDPAGIREREPQVRGLAGLWVPQTGVIDFGAVTRAYAADVERLGGTIHCGARVRTMLRTPDGWRVQAGEHEVSGRFLLSCAGAFADRLARLAGLNPGVRIVPFRGEWFTLRSAAAARVRGLVYPVPDPGLPFLGVHLTRRIDGEVWAGPNAVLALGRDGYRWRDIDVGDTWDVLRDKGFRSLARRWWRTGATEMWRGTSRRAYLPAVRAYLPELSAGDLDRRVSGVRAQAVTPNGDLVDDFHLVEGPGTLHVLNAPSPAATASLAIAEHLAGRITAQL